MDKKWNYSFGDFGPEISNLMNFDSSHCLELPLSWTLSKKVAAVSNGHLDNQETSALVNNHKEIPQPSGCAIMEDKASEKHIPAVNGNCNIPAVKEEPVSIDEEQKLNDDTEEQVVNGVADLTSSLCKEEAAIEDVSLLCNVDDTEQLSSSNDEDVADDSTSRQEEEEEVVSSNEEKPEDTPANAVVVEKATAVEEKSSAPESAVPRGALVEQENISTATTTPSISTTVSWAGLFKGSSSKPFAAAKNTSALSAPPPSPAAAAPKPKQLKAEKFAEQAVSAVTASLDNLGLNNHIKISDDSFALQFAEKLKNQELIYKPQAKTPRGFKNTSNNCFMAAICQALLASPPLYQLLKSLPLIPKEERPVSCTPVTDAFIKLASNFRQLSLRKGYQPYRDIPQDPPFDLSFIYDMLAERNPTLFQKGVQGDAEEFCTFSLNGMHEEMRRLLVHYDEQQKELSNQQQAAHTNGFTNMMQDASYADHSPTDDWEEVTKKNKSAVTRKADVTRSHISDIFRGVLSCVIYRQGGKQKFIQENFFCLPIDVQAHRTVEEALSSIAVKEHFQDAGDSKVTSSRHQAIDVLPPVLILHLKRFVYKNGSPAKLDQELEFKTDLIIEKEILTKSAKKLRLQKRSYKLFAVVNHHGENSSNGHYSTDVFHIGMSAWLRMDDDKPIRSVRNIEVTKHTKQRTPYLLFYRRTDLG